MSSTENVIIRYELARIRIRDLNKKRNALLKSCEKINGAEYPLGSPRSGKTCLSAAYDELISIIEDSHGDGYPYYKVVKEMSAAGDICGSCYESHKIKKGPLADAKKEFFNAKRAVHYAGMKLLKEGKFKCQQKQ